MENKKKRVLAGKVTEFIFNKIKIFVNNMELEFDLLLYFEKKRILFDMKTACETFLGQLNEKTVSKFPPLRYLLEVDVMELYETFPKLGDFLVKESVRWQNQCDDIMYACLKSLDDDNNMIQFVQSTQVAVNIRLTSLPYILWNPKQRKYTNLMLLYGLLIDISKPTSYVYHTVWSCPEDCEGNEIILKYIPKTPPKCYVCRSTLFENGGRRRCGDQVIATFKVKTEMLLKKFVIVDDLIQRLRIGGKYSIHIVILKESATVWSVEEIITPYVPITSPIPPRVKELYEVCGSITWTFIYCLASSIGMSVPTHCFMNLKVNLLLSLASVKANSICDSPILHFLARGLDTGRVAELMTQAATLADSHTFLGTSQSSVSTALIAASGGVCILPLPLQNYSQKQIYSVLSIIESGEITQGANVAKLSCAIWAQGMDFKKIVFCNIGKVFGNVCCGDYGEYADELADDMLLKAVKPLSSTEEEKETLRDISVYLDLIAGIKVTLTEETERLLRSYFLAARKERPDVTVGNFGALIATCTTSARLCRRGDVNNRDVVLAIWLHVSSMPKPRLAPDDYLETPADVKMFDNMMNKFIDWLEQFIGCMIL